MIINKSKIRLLFLSLIKSDTGREVHTLFYNKKIKLVKDVLSMYGETGVFSLFYQKEWIKVNKHVKKVYPSGCQEHTLNVSLTFKGLFYMYKLFV